MTAPATNALFDDLGPKGRRTVRLITGASAILVLFLLYVAYRRLETNGQLEPTLYTKMFSEDVLRFLLGGIVNTLKVAFLAMVLSTIVGAVMALGRLAKNKPIRWLSGAYVEIFRAWPLFLVILFAFVALPFLGYPLSPFSALVIGLTLYNGAMLAEVFRAGILSLDRGQTEAAASLGMTYRQSMQLIVIPQAGRRMLPAMVSQLIALLKDTSLGIAVTYEEFLGASLNVGRFEDFLNGLPGNLLQALAFCGLVYFIVNFILSRLARRLEVRQQRRLGGAPVAVPAGSEDFGSVTTQRPQK